MQLRLQPNQEKSDAAPKQSVSLRCCCGSLLARVIAEGVELKCRRCKRRIVVPLQGKAGGTIAV